MSKKAFDNFSGVVSEEKVSTGLGVDDRTPLATVFRLSGLRARRATAKLPWAGEARIRAMPAPCCWLVGIKCIGRAEWVPMLGRHLLVWQVLWVAL